LLNDKKEAVSGWGRYPVEECYTSRPETENDLKFILLKGKHDNYIPFGLGRSYGDTPLNRNEGVIFTGKFNKFINFDSLTGILECESGVTFEEIIEVFLPKGYFLPVTPGTKYITLGGAISNDVHGKNHHVDGSFSEHVIGLRLLIADGTIIECSREENSEIFWATVGGIGLTGIILTVKFKLLKLETSYYDVRYERAPNIEKAIQLFQESDDQYQYSVAWIDCLAKGNSLGKSVLMRGNHAKFESLEGKQRINPLEVKKKLRLNMPIDLPSFALNQYSIKLFNALYYGIQPSGVNKLLHFDPFFYPLDSVLNWNRMYGKKGFVQYQAVFPPNQLEGLIKLLEKLSYSNRSSFLAVLKSSGHEGQGMLSFPKKGYTLALDIPIKDDSIFPFLRELDELVIKHGGRVYLAKDSTLDSDSFKVMYPRLDEFLAVKNKIDPDHIFSSSMARRLNILEAKSL
jgi:decaprenylphospho-beta-D-ribofuranose 2-oxidase